MTKKTVGIGVIVSAVVVAGVLGFGAFMSAKAQTWSSEHRILSAPAQTAVNTGSFIHDHSFGVAVVVFAACLCLVSLAANLFVKR